jgi:hypothetical protein
MKGGIVVPIEELRFLRLSLFLCLSIYLKVQPSNTSEFQIETEEETTHTNSAVLGLHSLLRRSFTNLSLSLSHTQSPTLFLVIFCFLFLVSGQGLYILRAKITLHLIVTITDAELIIYIYFLVFK